MAVTKVINSESKQYKPVLTDMLVLDAVPTVNSLNGVTSDAVARAIAGASGEVPQVTENDNGKVLTAVYDEGGAAVEWAEAQGGDVDQTYDATSTNAQSGVAVAEAIAGISVDEVPTVGSSDDGKVLTASYSGGQGSYSWQTAQGGASYTAGDGISIVNDVISAKVGSGLEIGVATSVGNLYADSVYRQIHLDFGGEGSYDYTTNLFDRICTMSDDLVAAFEQGTISVLCDLGNGDFNPYPPSGYQAAIAIVTLVDGKVPQTPTDKFVFNKTNPGLGFWFDDLSINSTAAATNITWASIKANPSNYAMVIIQTNNAITTTSDIVVHFALGDNFPDPEIEQQTHSRTAIVKYNRNNGIKSVDMTFVYGSTVDGAGFMAAFRDQTLTDTIRKFYCAITQDQFSPSGQPVSGYIVLPLVSFFDVSGDRVAKFAQFDGTNTWSVTLTISADGQGGYTATWGTPTLS